MHGIVEDEFERHLSGNASGDFYRHLEGCLECRAEVEAMDAVSLLLRDLRPLDSTPEPRLGFYNRVAGTIIDSQRKEAWGFFSPGAAFFRRIAFASLLLLAALGSFLVTRESSEGGADPASVIAQHEPGPSHTATSDRDQLLVTLANYRQ